MALRQTSSQDKMVEGSNIKQMKWNPLQHNRVATTNVAKKDDGIETGFDVRQKIKGAGRREGGRKGRGRGGEGKG